MYTLHIVAPPPADGATSLEREPLGTRDAVTKRLTDLLPGLVFDERGRGAYHRGPYQLTFSVQGKEPTYVTVAVDQGEGFTVLTRITERTGWLIVDPETNAGIDLDASRTAGRIVHEGEVVPGAPAPAPPPVVRPRRQWSFRKPLLAAVVLTAAAVIALSIGSPVKSIAMRLPSGILASHKANGSRFEKYADRARRRAAVVKALPPEFSGNPIVEQMVDMQMASRAYWNFVDGRFSSPELLSNSPVWSRFLMPSFLPDSFGKSQRDGYSFEFRGEGCEEAEAGWPECAGYSYIARPSDDSHTIAFALYGSDDRIHFRTDGRTPHPDDPTIDRKR